MKTYKCIGCGNVFEADDAVEICPQCGSDNITPIRKMPHFVKGLLVGLLGIPVGLGIGFGVDKIVEHSSNDVKFGEKTYPSEGQGEGTKSDWEHTEGSGEPIILAGDIPVIEETYDLKYENGGYTLVVSASVASRAKLEYQLTNPADAEKSYTSDDGKFEKIPYTEDGLYSLKVTNTKNGAYAELQIPGFINPDKVEPLTKEDIQSYLSNPDCRPFTNAERKKFAWGYKLHISGLAPDEPEFTRFSDLLDEIRSGRFSNAKLTKDPLYDDSCRITHLYIKVQCNW